MGGNDGRSGSSSGWHGAGGGWQCTRSVCPCATPGGKFTMRGFRHCPGRSSGGSPTRSMPSVTASLIQWGVAGSS
eukprot:scaffold35071_cov57-Phaeocystis_antarctica.AAC.1